MSRNIIRFLGSSKFHFACIIGISLVLLFWNLGENSFRDLDEAIYVQVAKEVATGGDWLTLHLRGEPYFHKPPLRIWLNAAIFNVVGVNEFNARFLSALSGLFIVLLIYYFVKKVYGAATALLSSLILVLSPQFLFERCCRSAEEDALVVLFTCLIVYFFWKSRTQKKYLYVSGIFVGLAFLAKGLWAFFPVLAICLYLLVTREYKLYGIKNWIITLLEVIVIILPWNIAQLVISRENFFKIYLGEIVYFINPGLLLQNNDLTRFISSTVVQRIGQVSAISPLCDSWYYLYTIIVGFFPWSIALPFAFVYALGRLMHRDSAGTSNDKKFTILILCWLIVPLVLLSSLYIKRSFRINILYPAMAVLVARFFIDALTRKKNGVFFSLSLACIGAILLNSDTFPYGLPYYTFACWLDHSFGNFLLPGKVVYRFNNPHPIIGIIAVVLFLAGAYFLLHKSSRKVILKTGAFSLLASFVSIAGFGCFFLVRACTYKSDMHNIVRYIDTMHDPTRELIVWEDNLYRISTKPFNTFPSQSDKWGDYYYLHNDKNITITFLQDYAQVSEMLSKNTTLLLLTDTSKLQQLRAFMDERKITIALKGVSLVLLRYK